VAHVADEKSIPPLKLTCDNEGLGSSSVSTWFLLGFYLVSSPPWLLLK
jgi:hypothetical protein